MMYSKPILCFCSFLLLGLGTMAQQAPEKDSTETATKGSTRLVETGQLSLGYEYGLLPYLATAPPPQGNVLSEGMLGFSVKKLPFQAQYRYSQAGAASGLNNYFTIRFDAQRYRQQLKQDLAGQQLARMDSLKNLEQQRNGLTQKLAYFEQLKSGQPGMPGLPNSNELESAAAAKAQQEMATQQQNLLDSLNGKIPGKPTLPVKPTQPTTGLPQTPQMSAEQLEEYRKLQQQATQLDRKIRQMERFKDFNTDSLVDHGRVGATMEGQSKMNKALNGLQKFEIGMCYPDHSDFLVARVPVQGVNLAYQYEGYQLFFTHGLALQPQFTARELVRNQLNPVGNFSGILNPNDVDRGRRITAVKGGYGKQEGSHLYGGVLFGKGKVSYWDTTSTEQEKNYALELDGRWQLSQDHYLNVVWGRSHTQIRNPALREANNTERNQLFDLGERTNALKAEHGFHLRKTRTQLTTTVRWVDPYFKSHGVGFMRTDNLRYQLRVNQSLGKKWKVGGFVSREEDNLLKLYDYTTTLFSYGVSTQFRPIRSLSLRADFRPMALTVDQEGQPLEAANRNWISTLAATWFVRKEQHTLLITGLYTRYQLQDQGGDYHYENAQISAAQTYGEHLKLDGSYSYFHTNDTVGFRNTHLLQNDFSFRVGKFTTTLTAKSAVTPAEWQWGYGAATSYSLSQGFALEASFEKLVLGESYFQLSDPAWKRFPYYSSLRLVWQW